MAEALHEGADTIVTSGGIQSNHCRQTLSYAVMLGMECHLVLYGTEPDKYQGNLLIYKIFGAHIHFEPDEDKCVGKCEAIFTELVWNYACVNLPTITAIFTIRRTMNF